MQIKALLFMLLFFSINGFAQPVFDVLSLQYQHIPASTLLGEGKDGNTDIGFLQAQLNLPWKWNRKNTMVFNPQYESRSITFKPNRNNRATPLYLQSYSFTLSNQYVLNDSNRQILAAAGIRHYASTSLSPSAQTITPAFALLYAQRENASFAWKLGGYYSQEMFGNFWLPLIGFDWKASERFWCWGILPRYAVFDYTVTPNWHSCIVYKGVTDTYRLPEDDWFLIGEGQLRWANDFYIPHSALMLTFEIGHSAARQFKFYDAERFDEQKLTPSNGIILKGGITYRVATDKRFKTSRISSGDY